MVRNPFEDKKQLNLKLLATQRTLLITLLEEGNGKSISKERLYESVRITSGVFEILMDELVGEGLVEMIGNEIKLDLRQRLEVAIKAVKIGADFERVSRSLGWLEFEEMAAHVFEENGFMVHRRFRFLAEGRRWEIDVLAYRKPHIICTECKHWTRSIGNSQARKIIEIHLNKTEVLSRNLKTLRKNIGIHRWKHAILIPMALSLLPTRYQIYRRVPSVSVLSLPTFLSEYEGQLERLAHFEVEMPELRLDLKQTKLKI